ncbi:hypothetical protein GOP80_01520 [Planococcaceae bacterium Storch 2/2-2]|nr:hypothetical protein [Planococcaceae bacterium Storch 2/2-2]
MLQQTWSMRLIRFSAIFGLVGAVLGSHMAGSGSYAFRPIHAHIVLVSWLSVFAWGAFYRMYEVRAKKLISLQGWSAMIGSIGLTGGMWLQFLQPFDISKGISLGLYIVGGSVLLLSFALFIAVTFMIDREATFNRGRL